MNGKTILLGGLFSVMSVGSVAQADTFTLKDCVGTVRLSEKVSSASSPDVSVTLANPVSGANVELRSADTAEVLNVLSRDGVARFQKVHVGTWTACGGSANTIAKIALSSASDSSWANTTAAGVLGGGAILGAVAIGGGGGQGAAAENVTVSGPSVSLPSNSTTLGASSGSLATNNQANKKPSVASAGSSRCKYKLGSSAACLNDDDVDPLSPYS